MRARLGAKDPMVDYVEALELADEIIEMIEDDLPEDAYSKALCFFDSVLERTKEIKETIECAEDVTPGQVEALENMHTGVKRWFH